MPFRIKLTGCMHAINAIISEQLNSPDTFTTDLIQIKAMSTESPLTKNGEIRTPSKPNCTPNDEDTKTQDQAIENATALADASYSPPQSLLNSPSPHPLIWSVDGVSLRNYNRYVSSSLPAFILRWFAVFHLPYHFRQFVRVLSYRK